MSERVFRLIMGGMLFIALTSAMILESQMPVHIVLSILAFEAITNWRIPIIITRLRYGEAYKKYIDEPVPTNRLLSRLEAERMLRIVVIVFVFLPNIISFQYIEFLPWFVATALVLAGVTNICPMVMSLRSFGMR